jgi:hypothetical protein
MFGIITFGHPHLFLLVGDIGVPPICRAMFKRRTNSIFAKQMCFQCLRKIEGFLRVGLSPALSVIDLGPRKRSTSYMNSGVNVTEVRIWL